MPNTPLLNWNNEKVGSVELPDAVFSAKINRAVIQQVVNAYRANRRQGTAKTKTKAEVRGGGRKPFRQKGTGNARQGSIRSPLKKGGGQTFGPVPRSYRQATPPIFLKQALVGVLSDRFLAKKILVLEKFDLKNAKTKELKSKLSDTFKVQNVLLVEDKSQTNMQRAARNLPRTKYVSADLLNSLDVLKSEWVFLTRGAVDILGKRLDMKASRS